MIQRIQSVFLVLAALLAAFTFAFPLASFFSETVAMHLFITGPMPLTPVSDTVIINRWFIYTLVFLNVGSGFLALVAMFQYKNRLHQLKLVKIALLMNVVLVAVLFVLTDFIKKKLSVTPDYDIAIILPVIGLILLLLAQRGIKKDEEKVKSTSRIR
ncbi:MAG: DUF4293 family protein [Bacteroidales bacterium]|nr:DUF4293 family protein [Bacteroidales bacterium]